MLLLKVSVEKTKIMDTTKIKTPSTFPCIKLRKVQRNLFILFRLYIPFQISQKKHSMYVEILEGDYNFNKDF